MKALVQQLHEVVVEVLVLVGDIEADEARFVDADPRTMGTQLKNVFALHDHDYASTFDVTGNHRHVRGRCDPAVCERPVWPIRRFTAAEVVGRARSLPALRAKDEYESKRAGGRDSA